MNSSGQQKTWTCLTFVVVKVARDCGVKRGKRRKVRWGEFLPEPVELDRHVGPTGGGAQYNHGNVFALCLLDFANIFIQRTTSVFIYGQF